MDTDRTIVVGGGLAGLTAAATLARAGRPVTVIEGAEHLGGRARSRHRLGYDLNLGPHALYKAPGGLDVLKGLGVPVRGRRPKIERAGVLVGGELIPATRHLRRNVVDRLRVARGMGGLGAADASLWAGQPAQAWIDHVTDDEVGRATLASVLRTSTYAADFDVLDAGAAASQLRAAMHGVLYLHGGWSSLVDGLAAVVRRHGGEIITGRPVSAVEHDDRVRAVHLADGGTLPAAAVVVAVNDPRRAAGLLAGDGTRRASRPSPTPPSRSAWPTSTSPCGRCHRPGSRTSSGSMSRSTSTSRARSRHARRRVARSSTWGATCVPARSTSTIGRGSRPCSTCTSRTGATTSSMPVTCPARW